MLEIEEEVTVCYSMTPAKTLIPERISSRDPEVIAENYFSLTCISKVFASARLVCCIASIIVPL